MNKDELISEIQTAADRTGLEVSDIIEMLPDMVANESNQAGDLIKHYNNKEFEKVKAIAHSMKGAASTYGLQLIADLAHDIEQNPQDGLGWDVPEKIEEIISIYNQIKTLDI